MNRSIQVAIFFWVLCVIAGCAGTGVEPGTSQIAPVEQPDDEISGAYRLVAVNGVRVPGEILHGGGGKIRIESGSIKFRANGRVMSQTHFIPPDGNSITRKVRATYTRNGSRLLMQWENAGTTRGSIDDDVFVMNNKGMILVYSRSGEIDATIDLQQLGRCEPSRVDIITPTTGVFDDFEKGLPTGADCPGNSIGFFTFRDSPRSRVEISTTADYPWRPGETVDNRVLRLDLSVEGWAGVIHNFANPALDTWTPRNWQAFKAFSFWLHGNNSGTALFIDILDNRRPGSTHDDAERYTYQFNDDFVGWKKLTVSFRDMLRKPIGNHAPADGFNLHEVNGWGFGTTRTTGPLAFYLDDFERIPYAPGESRGSHETTPINYPINELPMFGHQPKTRTQRQADEQYIESMMRRFNSRAEAARAASSLGWKVYYAGDSRTAIRRFNQAWLLDPLDQYALWGFAVISADRGQLQKAAARCR